MNNVDVALFCYAIVGLWTALWCLLVVRVLATDPRLEAHRRRRGGLIVTYSAALAISGVLLALTALALWPVFWIVLGTEVMVWPAADRVVREALKNGWQR